MVESRRDTSMFEIGRPSELVDCEVELKPEAALIVRDVHPSILPAVEQRKDGHFARRLTGTHWPEASGSPLVLEIDVVADAVACFV